MAVSNITTIINNDIQKVWNIVLTVDKYNLWRSDLSKTEIINDSLKLYRILITNIQSMLLICWDMERAINPLTYAVKNFIIFIFSQSNKLQSSWDWQHLFWRACQWAERLRLGTL